MRVLFLLLVHLFVSSCGKNKFKIYPIGPAQFVYEINENSCTTGKHEFFYLIQMCDNLLDNSINNNCALEERRDVFNESCDGDFAPY